MRHHLAEKHRFTDRQGLYSAIPNWRGPMAILPGRRLGLTKSSPLSVRVEWARFTRPAIHASIELCIKSLLISPTELIARAVERRRQNDCQPEPSAHLHSFTTLGHQDEFDFLVMEYIEGETLDNGVERFCCRWNRCCNTQSRSLMRWKGASQGHHPRDLKPGNIMLTSRGRSYWTSAWRS